MKLNQVVIMETKQDLQANTELMIVEQTKSQAQTVIDLCPRFLKPELEISCYDKNYNLLEVPVFRNPPRKIKEGVNQESEIDRAKKGGLRNG